MPIKVRVRPQYDGRSSTQTNDVYIAGANFEHMFTNTPNFNIPTDPKINHKSLWSMLLNTQCHWPNSQTTNITKGQLTTCPEQTGHITALCKCRLSVQLEPTANLWFCSV